MAQEQLLTHDGRPLKQALRRALRREKMRSILLIAPLLAFVLVAFIAPIADMLFRSVENNIVADTLPKTVVALQPWDASKGELPDEATYEALLDDLVIAVDEKIHTRLGSRLNYEQAGMSSLFRKSGRVVRKIEARFA